MFSVIMLGNKVKQLAPNFNRTSILTKTWFIICRDHADWDEEQEQIAKEKVSVQLDHPVPEEEQGNFTKFSQFQPQANPLLCVL